MGSLLLPVYTVGMPVSVTQPQHRKNVSGADPRFSSSFLCVYSSSSFGSQAVVSCSSLLRSTSSSSCGYSMPSWPYLCFSLFTLSMVVGHHSVSRLQTIWIPLLQSTTSRCTAGLPQALRPVALLPMFFPDGNWSYSCYVTRTSLHSLSCLG